MLSRHCEQMLLRQIQHIIDGTDIRLVYDMYTDQYGEIPEHVYEALIPYVDNIHNGLTKIVFEVPDFSGFVVKIPLCGRCEDGEEVPSHKYIKANDYCPWDYCYTEVITSNIAKNYGLGNLFIPTFYLGKVNNYPIYYSPKVTELYDYSTDYSDDNLETATKLKSNGLWVDMDDSMLALFIKQYGAPVIKRLLKFLKDMRSGDFHCDNVAYKDGKLVIIDCAGFRG